MKKKRGLYQLQQAQSHCIRCLGRAGRQKESRTWQRQPLLTESPIIPLPNRPAVAGEQCCPDQNQAVVGIAYNSLPSPTSDSCKPDHLVWRSVAPPHSCTAVWRALATMLPGLRGPRTQRLRANLSLDELTIADLQAGMRLENLLRVP